MSQHNIPSSSVRPLVNRRPKFTLIWSAILLSPPGHCVAQRFEGGRSGRLGARFFEGQGLLAGLGYLERSEPVEERGRHLGVTEHGRPIAERARYELQNAPTPDGPTV